MSAFIQDVIRRSAERYGVPLGFMTRTAGIESRFNPNAYNKSGAAGLYQFMPGTARQYNLTNPYDPAANADAAGRLTLSNQQHLRKSLKREPTEAELYLAHQQGAAGATKILSNPNGRAVDTVGRQAVLQNGGNEDWRNSQFSDHWARKYAAEPGPTVDPTRGMTGAGPGLLSFGISGTVPTDGESEDDANFRRNLGRGLGRDATDADVGLARKFDTRKALALGENPDRNVIDALAPTFLNDKTKAGDFVRQHGGTPDMSAGAFVGGLGDLRQPSMAGTGGLLAQNVPMEINQGRVGSLPSMAALPGTSRYGLLAEPEPSQGLGIYGKVGPSNSGSGYGTSGLSGGGNGMGAGGFGLDGFQQQDTPMTINQGQNSSLPSFARPDAPQFEMEGKTPTGGSALGGDIVDALAGGLSKAFGSGESKAPKLEMPKPGPFVVNTPRPDGPVTQYMQQPQGNGGLLARRRYRNPLSLLG